MNPVLDFGIQMIIFLQGLGDWLTGAMQFFSFLGNEEFFLLIMPILYWCVDSGIGMRVGLILIISNSLNAILKIIFHGPRPFFYDGRVRALTTETSFGIPSGHAQNSAAVWGLLAIHAGGGWWVVGAIILVFLIGLSRLYLGVHFPTDVLLGWLAGALLVWGFIRLEAPVKAIFARQKLSSQLFSVFLVSLVPILLAFLARLALGAWTIPEAWIATTALTNPGGEPPDPLAFSGIITNAGVIFGLAAGVFLLAAAGGFDSRGVWWKRLLRFPIGLVGVVLFYFGLGTIFPGGEGMFPFFLRYIRYALVGLWIAYLAPMVFIWLGLAQPSVLPTQIAREPAIR